jgi:hypothetical protein
MQENSTEFWQDILNKRAAELGLEAKVKPVLSPHGEMGALRWVYEGSDGLIDLGWSVEEAEMTLANLAGANL